MHDEPRRHTGLENCACVGCDLVRCGAVDGDWPEWAWVWLSGECRVLMMSLTLQPPVLWCGPKTQWAGTPHWFGLMGQALDFKADETDKDNDDAWT